MENDSELVGLVESDSELDVLVENDFLLMENDSLLRGLMHEKGLCADCCSGKLPCAGGSGRKLLLAGCFSGK